MGRAQRPRPRHLAVKLKRLRLALGYTQRQMFVALQDEKTPTLYENHINLFESGRREPDLPLLLNYARVAGVTMETLVDDEVELPSMLPPVTEVEGIMPPKNVRQSNQRR